MKVANAPCSWGILEFDLEGQAADYIQVLNEITETGYNGTELGDWGFMPTEPGKLKEELQARSLQLLGAFVPVALKNRQAHQQGKVTALRTARLLAEVAGESPMIILADDNGSEPARTQNAGRIQSEHSLSPEEWLVFADGAQQIAQAVRHETGLRTVFHHHCAGYVETPWEIDQLMSLTDAQLLGLCFDTGHYRLGGGDPLDGLKRYKQRIWHVHFKDFQPLVAEQARRERWDYFTTVRNGIFCELGQGEVDFSDIKNTLEEMAYSGWIVVEQDVLPGMGSPKESALRNRNYLAGIGI